MWRKCHGLLMRTFSTQNAVLELHAGPATGWGVSHTTRYIHVGHAFNVPIRASRTRTRNIADDGCQGDPIDGSRS
jgi:hypothetical protein